MSQTTVSKLMSYGLDFLSAQPVAGFIDSYTEACRAEAFDRYMASVERWDDINY
jgi:hypothetical protein